MTLSKKVAGLMAAGGVVLGAHGADTSMYTYDVLGRITHVQSYRDSQSTGGGHCEAVLFFALFVLTFNAEGACSSDARGKAYPTRSIALQEKHTDGVFYYRADRYAIVVEPATLTRRLEEQAGGRNGTPSDERLLKDIRTTTLGNRYKDLFALVLKDPLYLRRIELLLADILEKGRGECCRCL